MALDWVVNYVKNIDAYVVVWFRMMDSTVPGFPNIIQPSGISRDNGTRLDKMIPLIPGNNGRSLL